MEQTTRVTAPELEKILGDTLPVLDHGFIRVVDYMGDDSSIVQAARVSYGKGTKRKTEDRGLIRYLLRHRHTTPFEMCEIKLHVKLPVFVARQWIRHRTANVNEYSARYSILDKEFYIPTPETLATQSVQNNQGRGETFPEEKANEIINLFKQDANQCYENYESMISEENNVARELARMNLPVNVYTQWYWKTDLHNLMHFISLRADPHAQYEIRVYADLMLDIMKKWVPVAAEAYVDYRQNSSYLSKQGMDVIKRRLKGETVTFEDVDMSQREWNELEHILQS